MGKVTRAGDLLSQVFNENFDPDSLEMGRKTAGLLNSWAAAAYEANIPAASDHSRIKEVERGVVVIEAEHPGWVQILQTTQARLLKILQRKYPDLNINGLSFCLSKEPISRTVEDNSSGSSGSDGSSSVVENRQNEPFVPSVNITPSEGESSDPVTTVRDEALYESLNKFKKVIQKRNRNNPESAK